jgi:hypothetical protein
MYNYASEAGKLFVIFLALILVNSTFALNNFVLKRDGSAYELLFNFADSNGNIGTVTANTRAFQTIIGFRILSGSFSIQRGNQISPAAYTQPVDIDREDGAYDVGFDIPAVIFTSPNLPDTRIAAQFPRWRMRLMEDDNYVYVTFDDPRQGATGVRGGSQIEEGLTQCPL